MKFATPTKRVLSKVIEICHHSWAMMHQRFLWDTVANDLSASLDAEMMPLSPYCGGNRKVFGTDLSQKCSEGSQQFPCRLLEQDRGSLVRRGVTHRVTIESEVRLIWFYTYQKCRWGRLLQGREGLRSGWRRWKLQQMLWVQQSTRIMKVTRRFWLQQQKKERPCVFIKPILELFVMVRKSASSMRASTLPGQEESGPRQENNTNFWYLPRTTTAACKLFCGHSMLDNQDRALSLPYGMVVAMSLCYGFGLRIDVTRPLPAQIFERWQRSQRTLSRVLSNSTNPVIASFRTHWSRLRLLQPIPLPEREW